MSFHFLDALLVCLCYNKPLGDGSKAAVRAKFWGRKFKLRNGGEEIQPEGRIYTPGLIAKGIFI